MHSLIELLIHIADLYDLKKEPFKARAYRKAAQSIRNLSEPIETIAQQKKLEDIPGVGKAISSHIQEYIETGHIHHYEELLKQFPKGIVDLFDIPNLGPKTIQRLYHELNISSISKLRSAAKAHKISNLKGFGEQSEKELLEGISQFKQKSNKMLLGEAYNIAQSIQKILESIPSVKEVHIVGSVLRGKELIKDIDILCSSKNPDEVIDIFTNLPKIKKVIAKGKTKSSIIINPSIQIDLRVLPEKQIGSAIQYFTGSQAHNIRMRQIAIKKGMKLSEYGLTNRKSGRLIESQSEQKIYNKLGLQWIPPELREDNGEIELAEKKKIPTLVTENDILGDFHSHTTYTDGAHTLKEMADAAQNKGYKYFAITDHTKSTSIANGNTETEFLKELKSIKMLRKNMPMHLLSGSEVDIKSNGDLDFSNSTLKKMDVVVASIHSGFKKDNTKRILDAISNPHVNCLGHISGRLLNKRPGYLFDPELVLQSAKDNNVAIEINSQPIRLDANEQIIREAKDIGCKFMINSDAHSIDGLDVIKFGVMTARRGYLEKKDIVNTWKWNKVSNWFEI